MTKSVSTPRSLLFPLLSISTEHGNIKGNCIFKHHAWSKNKKSINLVTDIFPSPLGGRRDFLIIFARFWMS